MPSRGFFSWGSKARSSPVSSPKLQSHTPVEPRIEVHLPPQFQNPHLPNQSNKSPYIVQQNSKHGAQFTRASSQNDLNAPLHDSTSKRSHKFSSPLHNMPPYMQNIPSNLLPHFQGNPHLQNNARPHSIYWDHHNFPPQLLHDDRPGGRYVDPSLQIHHHQKKHGRYESNIDVSAGSKMMNNGGSRSMERNGGPANNYNNKPNKLTSSSSVDVRYASKNNQNDSSNSFKSTRLEKLPPDSVGNQVLLQGDAFNTLPPYWLPHEQLNETIEKNNKGKYSKNKAAKNKSKKSERTKEGKTKNKDKKQQRNEKENNLSHDMKLKLYRSHEELRSTYENDAKVQTVERLAAIEKLKQQSHQLGKLEKAQTLERLDNIDSMEGGGGGESHHFGSYYHQHNNRRDSAEEDSVEHHHRSVGDEMREIQHGPSNKQQLWMEEQERMRRSAENIAFRSNSQSISPSGLMMMQQQQNTANSGGSSSGGSSGHKKKRRLDKSQQLMREEQKRTYTKEPRGGGGGVGAQKHLQHNNQHHRHSPSPLYQHNVVDGGGVVRGESPMIMSSEVPYHHKQRQEEEVKHRQQDVGLEDEMERRTNASSSQQQEDTARQKARERQQQEYHINQLVSHLLCATFYSLQ